jgi:hypothetical protein
MLIRPNICRSITRALSRARIEAALALDDA